MNIFYRLYLVGMLVMLIAILHVGYLVHTFSNRTLIHTKMHDDILSVLVKFFLGKALAQSVLLHCDSLTSE